MVECLRNSKTHNSGGKIGLSLRERESGWMGGRLYVGLLEMSLMTSQQVIKNTW